MIPEYCSIFMPNESISVPLLKDACPSLLRGPFNARLAQDKRLHSVLIDSFALSENDVGLDLEGNLMDV